MCTLEKRGNIFILTLIGDDEHRLNPTLINSIRTTLASIKSQSSTALITTCHGKFFSNGFDLHWAQSEPSNFLSRLHSMADSMKPLIAELLSLPMPTIAAVTGHAAAAGFILALSHDYVIMRKDKGVLYMSELDIGMTVPEYMSVMLREKVGNGKVMRDVLLRAVKIRGDEAMRMGIVEKVCDGGEQVVEAAVGLGEELSGRGWSGEVYGEMRKSLYPDSCGALGLTSRTVVAPRF